MPVAPGPGQLLPSQLHEAPAVEQAGEGIGGSQFHQLALGFHPSRYVTQNAHVELPAVAEHAGDAYLHRESGAVLAPRGEAAQALFAVIQQGPDVVAQGAGAPHLLGLVGHQELDRLVHHFLAGVAEHGLRRRVPELDAVRLVHHDHRVAQGTAHGQDRLFVFMQGALRLPPPGAGHGPGPQEGSQQCEDRHDEQRGENPGSGSQLGGRNLDHGFQQGRAGILLLPGGCAAGAAGEAGMDGPKGDQAMVGKELAFSLS